jgi:hypothetical protein
MAQEQTPKRWRGLAKIVKIIKKTDNYYFWVRVTDDPHGDSELLEGACFFREAMSHGWMKKVLKQGDVIAVQLPPRLGDSSWMMYCAPNHEQPELYKPMIRQFLEEAERRDKEWSIEHQRRQQAAEAKADEMEERRRLAQEASIQKTLDIHPTRVSRQGVRVQCTLTHEELKLLERDAAADNINVSDHRWRGQYIRRLIMRSLKKQAV